MDDNGQWMSVADAARRLGVTRQAIQGRIKRNTIEHQHDNRGNPIVRVLTERQQPVSGAIVDNVAAMPPEPHQRPADAPEMVPASLVRDMLESQQAAHGAVLVAVQDAADRREQQHRDQVEQQRADHAAELVRVQSLHLDLVGRLQAQAAAERQLFLERVDSAEIRAEAAEARAERVEQRLDQVLDVLLSERRQPVADQGEREPWWRRLFGTSTRSNLKSE